MKIGVGSVWTPVRVGSRATPTGGSAKGRKDEEPAPPAAFTPYDGRAYNLDAFKIV